MKILWVKSDLLHPTTKGGHIRTLETLRWLHKWHEVHYLGFENNPTGEGVRRAGEYCTKIYPVAHDTPARTSPAFALQLIKGLFSSLPVSIFRYRSRKMADLISELVARERFDAIVCDFITPAINFPSVKSCVVFQHNVETMIWRRHAQTARTLPERVYLKRQAARMFEFERSVCRTAKHVIAVSVEDARLMREMFGVADVTPVPTGVDVDYFKAPEDPQSQRDGMVFVGSMDWLPNVDGIRDFCDRILPLIRRELPRCTLTIVGREPTAEIRALAEKDPLLRVTGTVPDVRPYLWNAAISIVPLRIGGGTRMKIYEAMAAQAPVVSTTIGAEGLDINPPADIRIADTAEDFARQCVELLRNPESCAQQALAARHLVSANFGWENVARQFETILTAAAAG